MNANELADYLDKYALARSVPEQKYIEQAATMLRQQQAEIEALKLGEVKWNHAFDLAKIEIADLKAKIEALKRPNNVVGVPSDKLAEMQNEIAELKHINRNWQISEAQLLSEIAELKSGGEPVAEFKFPDAEEYADDYEMDCDEGIYHPSEEERFLIADALMGYISDLPKLHTHPAKTLTDEEQFKDAYIANFLSAYMAVRYDNDCANGHPLKGYQPIEDAQFLANEAWALLRDEQEK